MTDSTISESSADSPDDNTAMEQGNIIEVEVTNIAEFGVFVRSASGEEGLVHISEVANEFVTNVNKYVKVGDKVQVKVLGRNKKGKLEFSIKKAKVPKPKKALFIRSSSENKEFEDVLNRFLKRSDEKQVDIRRNLKKKQGISKKKF